MTRKNKETLSSPGRFGFLTEDAKTNEIPIAIEILQALDVAGKIITTDALLTQKAFCQTLSERKPIRPAKITHHAQYSITSLSPHQASAERLLQLRRGHWAIENLSHRTRDVLLGEDASQIRCGNAPQVMAVLRNTVLTLLHICGYTHIAKALRFFAAHPTEALKIIQKTQNDN